MEQIDPLTHALNTLVNLQSDYNMASQVHEDMLAKAVALKKKRGCPTKSKFDGEIMIRFSSRIEMLQEALDRMSSARDAVQVAKDVVDHLRERV
jgi:hypothetical protein